MNFCKSVLDILFRNHNLIHLESSYYLIVIRNSSPRTTQSLHRTVCDMQKQFALHCRNAPLVPVPSLAIPELSSFAYLKCKITRPHNDTFSHMLQFVIIDGVYSISSCNQFNFV